MVGLSRGLDCATHGRTQGKASGALTFFAASALLLAVVLFYLPWVHTIAEAQILRKARYKRRAENMFES